MANDMTIHQHMLNPEMRIIQSLQIQDVFWVVLKISVAWKLMLIMLPIKLALSQIKI